MSNVINAMNAIRNFMDASVLETNWDKGNAVWDIAKQTEYRLMLKERDDTANRAAVDREVAEQNERLAEMGLVSIDVEKQEERSEEERIAADALFTHLCGAVAELHLAGKVFLFNHGYGTRVAKHLEQELGIKVTVKNTEKPSAKASRKVAAKKSA